MNAVRASTQIPSSAGAGDRETTFPMLLSNVTSTTLFVSATLTQCQILSRTFCGSSSNGLTAGGVV